MLSLDELVDILQTSKSTPTHDKIEVEKSTITHDKIENKKINIIIFKNNNNIGDADNFISINKNYWKFLYSVCNNLDKRKFDGLFYKTINTFTDFKYKTLENPYQYFRNCQFLIILERMAFIKNSLSQYKNSTGIIKICQSKNNSKNGCIIDDSTVIDKNTDEIRLTDGSNEEPHRGFTMFQKMSVDDKKKTANTFYSSFNDFKKILKKVDEKKYIMFDPIQILQRIIQYFVKKNMYNVILAFAWEIHDSPYLLNNENLIKLFENYDDLLKLWESNFISDHHGKFRIFILCIYYIELVCNSEIKEEI